MRKFLIVMIVVLSLLLSSAVSYAAANPSVVIVNPASDSEVFSDNLLISVKMTEPMTIKVSVYEIKLNAEGVETSALVLPPVDYPCNNNLSFFTKQISEVTPGAYRIDVDTLDSSKNKTYTNSRKVTVKEKTENGDGKVFDDAQETTTLQYIQNLFKNLFN